MSGHEMRIMELEVAAERTDKAGVAMMEWRTDQESRIAHEQGKGDEMSTNNQSAVPYDENGIPWALSPWLQRIAALEHRWEIYEVHAMALGALLDRITALEKRIDDLDVNARTAMTGFNWGG
jgi:hypothetical protein